VLSSFYCARRCTYRDVQDKYGELTTPSVLANCMLWVERVRSDVPLLRVPLCHVCLCANSPALAQGTPASDTGAAPATESTLRVAGSCLLLVAVLCVCVSTMCLTRIEYEANVPRVPAVQESGRRHKLLMLPPSSTGAQVGLLRSCAGLTRTTLPPLSWSHRTR